MRLVEFLVLIGLTGVLFGQNSKSGPPHRQREAAHQGPQIEGVYKRPKVGSNRNNDSVEKLLSTLSQVFETVYSINSGRRETKSTN